MFRTAAFLVLLTAQAAPAETTVLAAASTSAAVNAVIAASGTEAVASFAASGVLARQIEQGAPADLFISANPKWMTYLVEAGLVEAGNVQVLMSNRLVLIGPEGAAPLTRDGVLAHVAGDNFVMADPESAPVGAYGREALVSLGLWDDMAPAFVPVRNTLAAVAAVQSGDAALGLVYASDAIGREGVSVLMEIPADSHKEIRYLVAPVAEAADPEGADMLLAYLDSAAGADVLTRFGFLPVPEGE